jgi:putative hydrolase of the HAD superfamily
MMVRILSFDCDDTLASESFDKFLWNEEIPRLYAKKHGLSLEEGKRHVYAEYYAKKYVTPVNDWTDVEAWFNRFGLDDFASVLEDTRKHVTTFDDVKVLEKLHGKYTLIVVSNSTPAFLDVKLKALGLDKYFTKIFSVPVHLGRAKNADAYRKLLELLHAKPEDVVHVGDLIDADYVAPTAVGIKAFHLDRSGKTFGPHIVHSLTEFAERL